MGQAVAWPKGSCEVRAKTRKASKQAASESNAQTSRPKKLSAAGALVEKAMLAAADALLESAHQLDEWDQQ